MATVLKMTCPECGVSFERRHHRQQFCTPAHKATFGNRELMRGKSLVGLAQAWRISRNARDPAAKAAGKDAFTQFVRLIDEYSTQDREAGRASALNMFRRRTAAGLLD